MVLNPRHLVGAQVVGNKGEKLGKVEDVYYDNTHTSEADWVAVKTGMFGSNVSLVPLDHATFDGEKLTVPFSKSHIQNAPHHEPSKDLSSADEQALWRHYGMDYSVPTTPVATPVAPSVTSPPVRTPVAPVEPPVVDDSMVRSEEQLHVGTGVVETGKVRLRKHVVTETHNVTVPVSHEEVHVTREPIADVPAPHGTELSAEEHEVTLHAEKPVVSKDTVAKERVRLEKEVVQGEEEVSGEIRKEQIDVEHPEP